jgi:maltose O-acetyltransferase
VFRGDGSITIGRNTYLSNDSKIVCHPECSVTIGENTAIGDRIRVYTRNKIADLDMGEHSIAALEPDCFRYGDVSIGDNCWIGAQVSVIEGTTIGDNTTVGTHSVVTRDLPPHCVAAGNPAKVVKFKPYLSPAEVKQFSSEYPGVVDDSVRDKFL